MCYSFPYDKLIVKIQKGEFTIMKQKPWKNTLLTLFLFILLSGIETPVPCQLPENTISPSVECSIANELLADKDGINPLSDWDKPPVNIKTFSSGILKTL